MSDSSWQQAVLGELGVARRGLQALNTASSAAPGSDWGADSAPRPVAEPAPIAVPAEAAPDPLPAPAPPAPVVEPVPDPVPPPPPPSFAQPSADTGAPVAGRPVADEPVANPFAAPPAPAPSQPAAEQGEVSQPLIINPYEGGGMLQRDPFGDPPPTPDAPAPEPEPQPSAPPAAPPLFNPDFDPEMAVTPLVGGAPGAPPPAAEPEDEAPELPESSGQFPTAAQQPQQFQPQQPAAQGGGVPMADDLIRKSQHGDPLIRRVGRAARKAVGGSGPQDLATQQQVAALLQRAVPSYRQIAVASVRGGAGKTSMAALLATQLARHRGDRVLAMDADAELGSLPLRLGVRSEQSLFDLAKRQPRSFEEAAQYLARTETGLWVLSSTRGGRIAGEFTIETFQAALAAISRYFAAAVVDCGAGILTELHRGILGQTHGLVLVTPATADGALSARGALEWFAGNGQQALLSRTVIAMVTHAPQVGADLERAREMLSAWGLPLVLVPYDRHLAAGGSLDLAKLGEATLAAAGLIAAEAFARALGGPGVVR
ncbi:MinD/ParA family ATP-binding protein [Actinomadura atramentaria]|uniref:MinD/ParA family ATP-binding protein n=1 Tax=Actinomadura atramentaria TaxID=1990 RepID=UPI00035EE966|nr:MinD/ParA family protein [Actinomadura atramentaria]